MRRSHRSLNRIWAIYSKITSQRESKCVTHHSNVKLPGLSLKCFDVTRNGGENFGAVFDSAVHQLNLPEIQKIPFF